MVPIGTMDGIGAIACIEIVADNRAMKSLLAAAILIGSPTAVNAAEPECHSAFGPIVPNVVTARAIASAIIASRRTPQVSKKYRLIVELDEERPGGWIASQVLPPPRNRDPDVIEVTMGGGGMHMRIDRCTGEVSDIYYSR